ncbi:unnamed protein product, partial [marine sediment metagenome]
PINVTIGKNMTEKNIRNITKISDYEYRIDFADGYDPTIQDLTTGLQAYWSFNTSGNTSDIHTYTYDMTNSGADFTAAGKIGGAYDYTATEFPNMTRNDACGISDWPVSFCGWVFFNNDANYGTLFDLADDNDANANIAIQKENTDVAVLYHRHSGTITLRSNNTIGGDWTFLCAVIANDNLRKLYVNGNLSNTSTDNKDFRVGTDSCDIGRLGDTSPSSWADGKIDEVGLWDIALNDSQILALYNGGVGLSYPFDSGADITVQNFITQP